MMTCEYELAGANGSYGLLFLYHASSFFPPLLEVPPVSDVLMSIYTYIYLFHLLF